MDRARECWGILEMRDKIILKTKVCVLKEAFTSNYLVIVIHTIVNRGLLSFKMVESST